MGFPNGVASGDVTTNSIVLWARSDTLGNVSFTVEDADGTVATLSATVTDPAQPVTVELDGLDPATDYTYTVTDADGATETGTFETAAADGYNGLTFGITGDWRGDLAPYPAISNVAERDLAFFLQGGDTIYADFDTPASPALLDDDGNFEGDLADFRIKYDEVYGERGGDNAWADVRSSTAIFATIDDHEVINDFAGGAPVETDPRIPGAGGLINDTAAYEDGLTAWQEYHPLREAFYGDVGEARTDGERQLYRAQTFGQDAALFVLDQRSFRDDQIPELTDPTDPAEIAAFEAASFDPTRTLLGETQLQDLKDDLLAADEAGVTWKVVFAPEPIQDLGFNNPDSWEGYQAERAELLQFIDDNGIDNVVFVAGDIHATFVNNLTYATAPFGEQIASNAFEITTGSVAFDPPFGEAVVQVAAAGGIISPEELALYDMLPVAPDADDIPNDRDDFVAAAFNDLTIAPQGLDPIGLDDNLPQADGEIDARLIQGDWVAAHTFGWTEFDIDAETQKLTVTTFGVPSYTPEEISADPAAQLANTPQIVSQFEVNPVDDNENLNVPNELEVTIFDEFGSGEEGASEVVAVEDGRLFVTNGDADRIDVFQIATGDERSIDLSTIEGFAGVQSVAASGGLAAAAVEIEADGLIAQNGVVALIDAASLTIIDVIEVGVLPDAVTFSPDGTLIAVSNEGEFNAEADVVNDAPGTVSVIDVSTPDSPTVVEYGFTADDLVGDDDIRIFPGNDFADDVEPEFVDFGNNQFLWVSLQEANALARIDVTQAPGTDGAVQIFDAGTQDFSEVPFDPNDDGAIDIDTFDVAGLRQPDAIKVAPINGTPFIFTANEGDGRGDAVDGGDEARVGEILDGEVVVIGNETVSMTSPIEESQEVADVPDTAAMGEFDATLDGEANTITIEGTFSDLTSDLFFVGGTDTLGNPESPIHIHVGDEGENGPIVFNLTAETDATGRNGTFSGTFDLTEPQVQLFADEGYYVNLHTVDNPSGELRGQIVLPDGSPLEFDDSLEVSDDLERLIISTIDGDTDGDGDIDEIVTYGGRSFSIFDTDGNLVFDSGDDFEQTIAELAPERFNNDDGEILGELDDDGDPIVDNRSDAKGPEPEAIAVGEVNGQTYAFIGLERDSGVAIYNVTNPENAFFVEYIAPNFEGTDEVAARIAPETIAFISAEESETGNAQIAVAYEVSGTTIVYDLATLLTPIYEIQGAGHISPFLDEDVVTTGVVTAVTGSGFYLQDPNGDGDDATSDGIFVFDEEASVAVGDFARVAGFVSEFAFGDDLSVTELNALSTEVLSSGNALPESVVIGDDGRNPPTEAVISDDELPTNLVEDEQLFDPEEDGIDFYESLEGMLVTVDDPVAVSATNRFGETFVLADDGDNATPGQNGRGGININAESDGFGDLNPERIQLQFASAFADQPNAIAVGDNLADATGVVDYSFGNFEVLLTETAVIEEPSPLTAEVTEVAGSDNELTVASYNVLNITAAEADGDAEQIDELAEQIVTNLGTPDIVALQEIQDDSGVADDGTLTAEETLQTIVDAIEAAGGPTYAFASAIVDENNENGGIPGGNIRNAFLWNPDSTQLSDIQTLESDVLEEEFGVSNPNAFDGTRDPLLGTFTFNGEEVTILNNHFSSRFGSTPIFGAVQPFVQAGEEEREQQALTNNEVVDALLAENPNANVIVAGDLNTFEFTDELTEDLPGVGEEQVLRNLIDTVPLDEDRYTFIFQGNSQVLDHMFVSDNLVETGFDIVHVNNDFPEFVSDHEPIVASFLINPGGATDGDDFIEIEPGLGLPVDLGDGDDTAVGGGDNETIIGGNGDDEVDGRGGDDRILGEAGEDRIDGGQGDDVVNGNGDDDVISLGAGNDIADGGIDDDVIAGNAGDDLLRGRSGDDFIDGGIGNDTITGGIGDDRLAGKGGNDRIFAGADNDTVAGGADDDLVLGNAGDDNLFGGNGNDTVNGGLGDDLVNGDLGDDFLVGGLGDDNLNGGAAINRLLGGAGADVFGLTLDGVQQIGDFVLGEDSFALAGELDFDDLVFQGDEILATDDDGVAFTVATLNIAATDLTAGDFDILAN